VFLSVPVIIPKYRKRKAVIKRAASKREKGRGKKIMQTSIFWLIFLKATVKQSHLSLY
jgi:hypothetical protein